MKSSERDKASDTAIRDLKEELELTRSHLRASREEFEAANEELRAANEELQSINEEYRSTAEELETSKEELQSINEELQTVNAELKIKLDSVSRANDDLREPHGVNRCRNAVSRQPASHQAIYAADIRAFQHPSCRRGPVHHRLQPSSRLPGLHQGRAGCS